MARRTDPPASVVRLVRDRDGQACAKCGIEGHYASLTTHHRRNRGMGGSTWEGINLPSNLLTLCGSGTTGCHGWTTENPAAARRWGLSVSQHSDPAVVPVLTLHGWVTLTNDGDMIERETA